MKSFWILVVALLLVSVCFADGKKSRHKKKREKAVETSDSSTEVEDKRSHGDNKQKQLVENGAGKKGPDHLKHGEKQHPEKRHPHKKHHNKKDKRVETDINAVKRGLKKLHKKEMKMMKGKGRKDLLDNLPNKMRSKLNKRLENLKNGQEKGKFGEVMKRKLEKIQQKLNKMLNKKSKMGKGGN